MICFIKTYNLTVGKFSGLWKTYLGMTGKNTAIKQKIKRNIARNKEKMQTSGFEPTDASFEGQLINH